PNDRELFDILYVFGAKLSADGSLLFQPSTNGIDVYNTQSGALQMRLSLPFPLAQNFDSLVSDGRDNVYLALTGVNGSGVSVIDLTAISEPQSLVSADQMFISHGNLPPQEVSVPQLQAIIRTGTGAPNDPSGRRTAPHVPKPNFARHDK